MLIIQGFVFLVIVVSVRGSCSPNNMADNLQKCLQYQTLSTYWQFPFVAPASYSNLCSNSTCLTYCYDLVTQPCNGTYNTEHLWDGSPIKAAYLGFCDKNRTEVEAALTCANNVNNQDVLNPTSAFQTTIQGYADSSVTNGTAVCLDFRSLLDTLETLMNTQCSGDPQMLWQTFFNTLYAACNTTYTPSDYTKYRETPVSQCASAANLVTSNYRLFSICVMFVFMVQILVCAQEPIEISKYSFNVTY